MRQAHQAETASALLLVGHGSRDADGQREFLEFASRVQQAAGDRPVIPCFLELAEPTIPQGVARCLALGYRDITAVPVLLFAARHNKRDVPAHDPYENLREYHERIWKPL